jgi:hypothetical protein
MTPSNLLTLERNPTAFKASNLEIVSHVFIFLIPCLAFQEFELVGRLFLPEIILMAALPIAAFNGLQGLSKPLPKAFLILAAAWLFSQILTDLIRETPFEDWGRGWAKIGVFTANFVALYLLINNSRSKCITFGYGLAIGQIIVFFVSPNEYVGENSWKWGYGFGVTYLLALATLWPFFRRIPFSAEVIIAAAAIPSLLLNFRSLGATCLLASLFLISRRRFLRTQGNIRAAILTVLLLSMAAMAAVAAYEFAVTEGWLGDDAWEKYQTQTTGDFGLFLGGRSEILGSWQAIVDSPIIGHGSWAKNIEYVYLMMDRLAALGYSATGYYANDQIPTHSYFFGAWVEAGILGAVFWFWILTLVARAILLTFRSNEPIAPWVALIAFDLTWATFFSPFGALSRLSAAYSIIVMMTIISAHRSSDPLMRVR